MTELTNIVDAPKKVAPVEELVPVLQQWDTAVAVLAKAKKTEEALRRKVFGMAFVNPKEGVNKYPLPAGYTLEGERKINRTADQSAINDEVRKSLAEKGIILDLLLKYKPEVVVGKYKELTIEQRNLLSEIITEKEGLPSIKIIDPKEKKK
jgi:hypothetical protein